MEHPVIRNSVELKHRIMLLNAEKERQEEHIKHAFKELAYTLSPLGMIKNALRNVSGDEQVQHSLGHMAVSAGSDFLIGKVLGRNSSIKGYLASLIVQKMSGSFIQKNVSKVIDAIGKMVHHKEE